MATSFDFHPWKIQTRKGRKTPYRVRWGVAGRQFGRSFVTMALAESFRAQLITAARKGEGFDTESGLPESMERTRRDVSFYQHTAEFTASAWPAAAAKTWVSIIEALIRVVPVVVRDLPGAPDRDVLRRALRKKLNQGGHAGELDEDEVKAIAWLARSSRPVSALEDPSVVADVLTPEQLASPLMKRPYDLRHSGITWRLNSGVPATEVAAWAGHSVELLMRVYARCVVGLEDVWIGRMDIALHLGEDQ